MTFQILKWVLVILGILFAVTPFILVPLIIARGKNKTSPPDEGGSTWEKCRNRFSGLGRMSITLLVWMFLVVTIHEFFRADWDRFTHEHGWGYTLFMLTVATIGFCMLFGREEKKTPKSADAPAQAHGGGHGGHGEHGGGGVWKLVLGFIVLGIVLNSLTTIGEQRQVQTIAPSVAINKGPFLPVEALPDRWAIEASVTVEEGSYASFDTDSSETVLYRFNNGPVQEYRHGQHTIGPSPGGKYTIGFRSKGSVPVVVKVYGASTNAR